MSNATEKTAIANFGLLSVGEKTIKDITSPTTPHAIKIAGIFESVVRELLAEDWYFSRKLVKLADLVKVNKLTIKAKPSPAAFIIGITITGATIAVTCEVIEVLSD